MSDLLVFDVEGAVQLHHHLLGAADALDLDAHEVRALLDHARSLLDAPMPDAPTDIHRAAQDLRTVAADLDNRVRLVVLGGADMNAGLAALERVRSHFTPIEARGGLDDDGILSRDDLAWARDNLDRKTAAAATWLLDHNEFFTAVETASANDDYLAQPYDGEFHVPGSGDDRLTMADIDAFLAKSDAWATLLPHFATIDSAAHRDEADGVMSRADFEAFLAGYETPPDVERAVRRVLDDGAHHHAGGGIGLTTMLDAVSFVPVIGDLVDAGRALYFALNGDYATAALYGLGLVPLPGLSGSGIRGAVGTIDAVGRVAVSGGRNAAAREATRQAVAGTARNATAGVVADRTLDELDARDGWLGDANTRIAQRLGIELLTP